MRTIFCQKHQQTLEGLVTPPFPGERGKFIFENLSKQAWGEWLKHQTLLINEKKLNLLDPNTQQYLKIQLDHFIANETVDRAEGYTPKK